MCRFLAFAVLVVAIVVSSIACATAQPSAAPGTVVAVAATAVPVATPSLLAAATATATHSPVPTQVIVPTVPPALTATAWAFQEKMTATGAAVRATSASVQSRMGTPVPCQDIPQDRLLLTAPVPLPAEVGQESEQQGLVFRVPAGRVVRAPLEGKIRLGPWFIHYSRVLDGMTISHGDYEVTLAFPRGGYEVLLPGYDPKSNYEGASVKRGDPLVWLDGSAVEEPRSLFVGIDAFNVLLAVRRVRSDTPPYDVSIAVPLSAEGELWVTGVPVSCQEWLPEPTAATPIRVPVSPTPLLVRSEALPPPAYTGAIPAPSGRVAFTAQVGDSSEVFVSDLALQTTTQLTHGQWKLPWNMVVAWHPDGQRLFFTLREGQETQLVLLRADTGQSRAWRVKQEAQPVAWSPDGSTLLYASRSELYTAPEGSAELKRIYAGSRQIKGYAWSPDGQSVAFALAGEGQDGGIYVLPVTGGEPKRVEFSYKPRPADEPLDAVAPLWSPDGRQIVFLAVSKGGQPRACTVDLGGPSIAYPTSPWTAGMSVVSWLPDSRYVLLADSAEVYLWDTRSNEVFNLTQHPATDEVTRQSLSPDGQFLVFRSSRDHYANEIYILHVASGRLVARMTADFARQGLPVWGPR